MKRVEEAVVCEADLRVVRVRFSFPRHDDQFFAEACEMRIERNRQSEVGHGTGGVNRDLMRVPVNHPDKEMRGVFVGGFRGWRSLGHRWDFPGTMDRMLFCIVPRALVDNLSVKRLPALALLFTVYTGK